ncbi:hypothetical protein LC724_24870 [Blautia sp. RD014234]|nr:hypothetical protein [Blautia parvula]
MSGRNPDQTYGFFPYDSLWSLSSIATLFGFWMVTVTLVVLFSRSNRNAAVNVMLYLTAMNISFYLLKYILGLFLPMFDNEGFHWNLLALYTALACLCSIGDLYCTSGIKGKPRQFSVRPAHWRAWS